MKDLLLNSRAGWTRRLNTEPKTTFYATDVGAKASISARLATTPQRYAILRSGAPRFRKNRVSMRDGGHYDTDRTSLAYTVAHTTRSVPSLRSAVPRFAMTTRSQQNVLPRPYRRPDKQNHHLLPKSTMVSKLLDNPCEGPDHHKSIAKSVANTPMTMAAIRKSVTQRGSMGDTSAPHLGPGCYSPRRVGRRPGASARPKPKLRIRKRDVEKLVSEDPDVGLSREELELKRRSHLGPGAYFQDEAKRDVSLPGGHPGVRWSTGKRFKDPPRADSYKQNGSVVNPRRPYVEWVTPGNPMWREDRSERSGATKSNRSGADFMPTLDSGTKISLATGVAKGARRYAHVFRSAQPRLAAPGSVTAASRREFTPCTGPTVGPGAYEAKPAKQDDPPPFRSGKQRGDPRTWGDHFDRLRPRHLLQCPGSTALQDT